MQSEEIFNMNYLRKLRNKFQDPDKRHKINIESQLLFQISFDKMFINTTKSVLNPKYRKVPGCFIILTF